MKKNVSKNFLLVTIGHISSSGIQAIFYLIFASFMTTSSYGQMSYFIALAGIFSVISRFGFQYTVEIYTADNKLEHSKQINLLATITSAIAAIVLIPINEFASILSIGFSFFTMSQYNLLGSKNYKKYVWTSVLKSALSIILPIIFYFMFNITGILIGLAISNFVGSFTFIKSLNINRNLFQILKNYKFLAQNFGVDMAYTFPVFFDKILISPLFGYEFVGIYQFNMQILMAINLLAETLHSFLLSENSTKTRMINYYILIATTLCVLAAIIMAPIIIPKFFPAFSKGIFSLQIIVLASLPLALSSIFNAKLQLKGHTSVGVSAIIRISSLSLFILVFGNLYGLVGLSLAVVFSAITYTSFLLFLSYRKLVA